MKSKTIKKFSITMMLVAFVLMLGMTFGVPASVFANVTNYAPNIGETLQLVGAGAEYNIQEDAAQKKYVDLPDAIVGNGAFEGGQFNVYVYPQNASGIKNDITDTFTAGSSSYTDGKLYLLDQISNYKVEYVVVSASGVETKASVDVNIKSDTPTFKWQTNTQDIIPTEINRSTTDTEVKITFPCPYILNGEGDVLNETTDTNGTDADTTDDFTKPDWIEGLSVKLVGPKGEIAVTDNAWTVSQQAEQAPAGLYTVIYTYDASNSYTIKKEFTLNIVEETVETELLINGFSGENGTSSIPSSMALYVETNLPKPVVVNKKASNAEVDAFTEITLTCKPTDGGEKIVYNIQNTPSLRELKFTPKVAGKYTIEYKVTDFLGNTASYQGAVDGITATKTKESGSGYVVAGYAESDVETMKTKAEEGTLKTAEYMIPSIVDKGTSVTLPAIFGIDEVSAWDALTFDREVTFTEDGKTSSTTQIYRKNASNNEFKKEPNETIELTFANTCTYKITYRVKDASGNSLLSKTFNVVVEENYEDTQKPEVRIVGLPKLVSVGNEVKFKVSATDYRADDESKVADERLNVVVTSTVGTTSEQELILEDGYYTLSIPKETSNGTEVTIKATVTDGHGNTNTITQTLSAYDYTDDLSAPTASEFDVQADWVNGSELKTFNTSETITIPSITFTDNNNHLRVYAEVTCEGQVIANGTFGGYSYSGSTVTLSGKEIVTNLAGTYEVKYVATDVNGNTTHKVLTFKVNGPQLPIVTLGEFNAEYEYGDIIDLGNVSVTINTQEVDYSNNILMVPESVTDIKQYIIDNTIREAILVQVSGNVAYDKISDLGTIVAGQSGNITLKYWAVSAWVDDATIENYYNTTPSTITFSTADTTKPEIVVSKGGPIERFPEYDADANEDANIVKIPNATATDLSGVQGIKITAKYNNATKDLEIVKYAEDSAEYKDGYYGYFVANANGWVTVTYEVSDNASPANTQTKTFSIGIGDVNAPQISLKDLQNALEKEYKLNQEVTLDLTKISIVDEENLNYEDVTVKVTLNGETVTSTINNDDNKTLTFKMDKVGSYIVTVDVKDSAGNKAVSQTLTLTVPDKQSENIVSTTVWGTILIVVALIVLGVVIYFFVKPSKTKGVVKTTKKDDKEKDKDDKIEV